MRSLIQGLTSLGNTYYSSKTGFLWSKSCGWKGWVFVLRGSYSLSQNGKSPWATRTTCTEDLPVCVKTLRDSFSLQWISCYCLMLLSVFIKTPKSHILAELMLILPNTMSLTCAVLSVLKKMYLHLLVFKGMRSYGFKFPVYVFW